MKNRTLIKYIGVALLMGTLAQSCEDSIDRDNLPVPYAPIGGYENSDDIASANLVTKFSFENNLNDSRTNITNAVGTNVEYGVGAKGNAYNGSDSQKRYAVADVSSAITGLSAFTFSFWMKSANTVDPATPGQGKGAQGIFSIVRPTEFWGGINLFIENPDNANPDRIRLKLSVENGRPGVAWGGQSVMMNIDGSKNKWIYVTIAYDPTVSKVSAYLNGEPAANLTGFAYAPAEGLTGSAPWFADNPGGIDNPNGASGYGAIQMKGTNGKVVIGTHQFDTNPPLNNGSPQDWATSFAGMLDEFRIYNIPLKSADISALYKLEKDNR